MIKYIVIMLLCSFGLTGCNLLEGKKEIFEDGNFLYRESNNASFDYINIIGFTKEGRQKSEIAFPSELNGKTVKNLGNRGTKGIESTPKNYFHQEEETFGKSYVEKVFVPSNVFIVYYSSTGAFSWSKN